MNLRSPFVMSNKAPDVLSFWLLNLNTSNFILLDCRTCSLQGCRYAYPPCTGQPYS